jgi:hypothetical protein
MTKPKPKHLFLTKKELARRIRDGQSIAKKNGKHIGRPRTVDRDKVHQLRRGWLNRSQRLFTLLDKKIEQKE